jgi:hypothetical protein
MKKENHVAFIQFKLFWYDEREGKTEIVCQIDVPLSERGKKDK